MNKNTKEEWDNIWNKEGLTTWRTYPSSFSKICELIPYNSNVLELGCGIGILLYQIQSTRNCKVVGIDISDKAIKLMDEMYDIKGYVSSIPPIPKLDQIDVIVASQTLEHFEDPEILLKEIYDIANMAIFSVPNNILGEDECEFHFQKFTVSTLTKLIEKYYRHIEIYEITDIFMASKELRIKIPIIICKCWGRR